MTKGGLPNIGDSVYVEFEKPIPYPDGVCCQHGRHGKVTLVWRDSDAVYVHFPGNKWHKPVSREFSMDEFLIGRWNEENYTWELIGDYPELAD